MMHCLRRAENTTKGNQGFAPLVIGCNKLLISNIDKTAVKPQNLLYVILTGREGATANLAIQLLAVSSYSCQIPPSS